MIPTRKVEGHDAYVYEGQVYIPNTYTAGTLGTKVLARHSGQEEDHRGSSALPVTECMCQHG